MCLYTHLAINRTCARVYEWELLHIILGSVEGGGEVGGGGVRGQR